MQTTALILANHLGSTLGITIHEMKVSTTFIKFKVTIMGSEESLVFCKGDTTLEATQLVSKITSRNVKNLKDLL